MRNSIFNLFAIIGFLFAGSGLNAQNTFDFYSPLHHGAKSGCNEMRGNAAFCMVIGGIGIKGWSKFYLHDPTAFINLAPKPDNLYFLGADFGPDGIWYATEWDGDIYTVDTVSGQYTFFANVNEALSGFTYSPAYETFFACTGGELFRFDHDTHQLEAIGMMGNSGDMTGLGADVRGNLWGIDKNDDQLYSIDPVSGLATAIGPSGFDFDLLQNCTYDKNNDVMYHAGFWLEPNPHGALFTFNLETGEATAFTVFPDIQEVTSFAIPWTMPEHGSISGTVTEAATGNPVQGVSVYLASDDPMATHVQKITGNEGTYSMGVVLPGIYSMTAVSNNYGTVVIEDIAVNAGDNLVYDIQLEEAPYSATFHVFTFVGNDPVEGAEVSMLGQMLETNGEGTAVFENIAPGMYEYTVDHEGFYQGFGVVEVVDQDVEVSVYLYEENNVIVELVIMEEATGTWCGPCAQLAPVLDQIVEEGYPVGIIAYHASDNYENSFADARIGYYGIAVYPTLVFNGQDQINNEPYGVVLSYVEEYMDDETPVALDFSNVHQDIQSNTVSGTVSVENFGPVNSQHMQLQIVLIENHIPENWQGNTELNFVERTMFPDELGTSIDLSVPDSTETDFELGLEGILQLENCRIIAFVQDHFSKVIYNGTMYDCSLLTGTHDISGVNPVNIYPNPASQVLRVQSDEEIRDIRIYDLSGRMIFQTNPGTRDFNLNLSKINTGIFLLEIKTENKLVNQKVVVR